MGNQNIISIEETKLLCGLKLEEKFEFKLIQEEFNLYESKHIGVNQYLYENQEPVISLNGEVVDLKSILDTNKLGFIFELYKEGVKLNCKIGEIKGDDTYKLNIIGFIYEPRRIVQSYREFDIWCEGYVANGCNSGAYYLGKEVGRSLEEACMIKAFKDEKFAEYFNKENMSYWGCKIFDNKFEASMSFGF